MKDNELCKKELRPDLECCKRMEKMTIILVIGEDRGVLDFFQRKFRRNVNRIT